MGDQKPEDAIEKSDAIYSYNEIVDRIINNMAKKIGQIKINERRLESGIIKPGNNYLSDVSRCYIDYKLDGKSYEKYLFIKIPYYLPYYPIVKLSGVFKKEIQVYTTILPEIQTLLGENFTPEYFCSDGDDAFALEDLSQYGYRMLNRKELLNFEECAQCFRTLAKFHAASVKIHQTKPETLDVARTQSFWNSSMLNFEDGKYVESILNQFLKCVARTDPDYASKNADTLQKYKNRLFLSALDELKPIENELNVLNHGDFWCNNILFKFDKYGQISDLKLVDFQICCWTSPVIDLLYFTINSMKFEVFEKYFDLLLEIYANEFNAVLRYLKCDQKPVTVEQLKNIAETKYEYWLFAMLTVTPSILRDTIPDKAFQGFDDSVYDEHLYVEISKKWISYFISKGVFSKNDDAIVSVRSFLRKFREERDVEIKKYELDDNVIKDGNNFCSIIFRLRFEYVDKNGENYSESIILKIPSLSPNYEMIRHCNAYSKEIYVFEKFLPELRKLYPEGDNFTPNYYGTTDMQVLFLEDLNRTGYACMEKTVQFDLEHSRVALKMIARYHALTCKYLDTNRENVNLHAIIDSNLMETFINSFENLIDIVAPFVSKSMAEKLREYKQFAAAHMKRYFKPNENGKNVIVHGDCWKSNILFKYDEEGRVYDSKMIDWQLCRIGSPAAELIYFFVTSVRFEIFEKYEDVLLNYYLNEFNDMLKKLRCDGEYTRHQLNEDIKSYKFMYLNLAIFALPHIICNDTGKLDNNYLRDPECSSNFIRLLLKWLTYIESRGIL